MEETASFWQIEIWNGALRQYRAGKDNEIYCPGGEEKRRDAKGHLKL